MYPTKIINDPIYGFIKINNPFILQLIDHRFFQRLKRIKQLGLAEFVYPGAHHTRFHHALGAMHLMDQALNNLIAKGYTISAAEREAAEIAILLHDIGHGPFSHVLEYTLLQKVKHEEVSLLLMHLLNKEFKGRLDLAISMFTGNYPRKFFHQLISSQLDVDRLDYLSRDSFYTGVREGFIGSERLLSMLDLHEEQLVLEEKGIYSIENFLMARRLMYWQVYLHKTAIAAENMLIQILQRAKHLIDKGEKLWGSEPLMLFLSKNLSWEEFSSDPKYVETFAELDDHDIWAAIKSWKHSSDKILKNLSKQFLERKLFTCKLGTQPIPKSKKSEIFDDIKKSWGLSEEELSYFLIEGSTSNAAYVQGDNTIKIVDKLGQVVELTEASDLPTIQALSKIVKKYYFCCPKSVYLQGELC
ncbi:HD domain-containing protein [Sandaracinomonas limnophila]|uniref:HD domain-containing protein n=1 Tax=Sandaracinomonas limnophila TaxID=1862386 RepID=A0A437PX67_9BACT|nr:HD domain-containing protein [Sandaracinomonas limnophila]RVU26808.1 HD domain-containing protein [Sandaracinomonas limnophila]